MNSKVIEESASASKGKGRGIFLPLLLIVMSAYPPLSTDMYLPALTKIATIFNTPESTANLTLVLFFVFFAIATLVWGPLADRFGKRPALLTGIAMYMIASAACAVSQSVEQLIAARIFQALGAGAPVTISIAIVQDTYTGEQKKRILAVLSALMMIAPAVAPVFGAAVLAFTNWRIIFLSLFLLGLFSFAGTIIIRDSISGKPAGVPSTSRGSLFGVMKHTFFRRAVIIFSLPAVFILGFVGSSSLIFMSGFGISSTAFSIYFAVNALFSIIGSILYLPVSRRFSTKTIASVTFFIIAASGALLLLAGTAGPTIFLLCVIPGALAAALQKPMSVDILMDNGGPDSGAASAVINFLFTMFGSMGMLVVSMEWTSRIFVYGIMTLATGIISLVAWSLLMGNNKAPVLVEETSEI